jgi:hypothetical protein
LKEAPIMLLPFRWLRGRAARKPVRRYTWTRLTIERLEDRCLPIAYYGSFSQAAYTVVGDGRSALIAVYLSTSPVTGSTASTGSHDAGLQIDYTVSPRSATPNVDYRDPGTSVGTLL